MSRRILIVDDSPLDRRLAAGVLGRDVPGVVFEFAENGREALEKATSEPFDLVVTDIMMPEMNGLELLERLVSERPLLPVVMMTGAGTEEIAHRSLVLGAASYVPKRYLSTSLAPVVERLLSAHGASPARPVRYFSCFISHSQHDAPFCDNLMEALRNANVHVWYSPRDIRGGQSIHEQVRRAIYEFDRLLVVLSHHSLESDWVKTEVLSARDRERQERKRVLFPIRLLPFDELRSWTLVDPDTGADVAREIRGYFIPDFSDWSSATAWDDALGRLLGDLRINDDVVKGALG